MCLKVLSFPILHLPFASPGFLDSSLPLQPGRRDSFACRRGLQHFFSFPPSICCLPAFLFSCSGATVCVRACVCVRHFLSVLCCTQSALRSQEHVTVKCTKICLQVEAPPFPSQTAAKKKKKMPSALSLRLHDWMLIHYCFGLVMEVLHFFWLLFISFVGILES